MRQEYMEVDYVDGVRNKDGELVIRALNDEERDFLNKFNEEVVGANFIHDSQLRGIYEKQKVFRNKDELTEDDEREIIRLQLEYCARADEALLYPNHEDQKKLYGENNARNRCLINRSKATGSLSELNDSTYDEFHENVYNITDAADMLLINKIEKKEKKRRKRRKSKDL